MRSYIISLPVEQIYEEAMQLLNESKEILLEKPADSMNPEEITAEHLAIVKIRREKFLTGKAQLIDGETALQQARELINAQ